MIELPAIGTALIGLVAGAGLAMRRFSRDKLELAKDRAEENLIENLVKQRDDARAERQQVQDELKKVLQESEEAMKLVRELTAKEQQLTAQNSMQAVLIQRLAAALENSKAKLQEALTGILPTTPQST